MCGGGGAIKGEEEVGCIKTLKGGDGEDIKSYWDKIKLKCMYNHSWEW